jgi:hypothetical protein
MPPPASTFRSSNFQKTSSANRSWPPVAVVRRGQPQWAKAPSGSPILNESGFHAVAADFSNLKMEIADGFVSWSKIKRNWRGLSLSPSVEKVSLDFGIEERDMAAQSERFPPNLLRVVGNLGIWLEFTLYPCPDPKSC